MTVPQSEAGPTRDVTLPPRRTLKDKILKFSEGHNPQIWTAIGLLAVLVVWSRS